MLDKWDRKTDFCCASCAYYAPKNPGIGRCRRHAPTMAGYPVVYPYNDWCGDHRVGDNPYKADTAELTKAVGR